MNEIEPGPSETQHMIAVNESLRSELERAKHDIEAYRGALGYAIPGGHDGRLTDGTIPQCGLCNSEHQKGMESELAQAKELHTMKLAGIMTASIQNTETTVKDRIGRDNPYWTQAYEDVCRAVDREMKLRSELAHVKAENLKLMAAFINKPDTASGDTFLPAIDVKKLLAPTIELLERLSKDCSPLNPWAITDCRKELARLEAITNQ